MAIIEFNGGRINIRYLMNKTKHELAHMVMDYLKQWGKSQDEVERLRSVLSEINDGFFLRDDGLWAICDRDLPDIESILQRTE